MSAIDDYYAALERLKRGKPRVIKKSEKISNSSVAREAGRTSGSIKNNRHAELVAAITLAAESQPVKAIDKIRSTADKAKEKADTYRQQYEAALGREVMLLRRLDELENNK